eukprot:1434968-Rhodomonas_salina.1
MGCGNSKVREAQPKRAASAGANVQLLARAETSAPNNQATDSQRAINEHNNNEDNNDDALMNRGPHEEAGDVGSNLHNITNERNVRPVDEDVAKMALDFQRTASGRNNEDDDVSTLMDCGAHEEEDVGSQRTDERDVRPVDDARNVLPVDDDVAKMAPDSQRTASWRNNDDGDVGTLMDRGAHEEEDVGSQRTDERLLRRYVRPVDDDMAKKAPARVEQEDMREVKKQRLSTWMLHQPPKARRAADDGV